jgi:hypothetical protein
MSELERFVLHVFVGSLLLPTIGYLSVDRSRRAARPIAARIAAWMAMYVGQLGIPCALVAVFCLIWGANWVHDGHFAAAILYGSLMALVAGVIALSAARMFLLGPLVLSAGAEATVAMRATSILLRSAVMFGIVSLALCSVIQWIPIPGRQWEPLIYIALVIIPLALASSLLVLVSVILRRPPWTPPSMV